MFYDIFSALCRREGKKPGAVAEACGINRSNVSLWKSRGYTPRGDALNAIADYFGVSVDYLLGKEDGKKSPAQPAQGNDVKPILHEIKSKALQGITLMYDGDPINERTMKAFEASLEAAIALLEASKED